MNPDLQNSSQNHNMKPHLNQMAQEFTPQSAVLRKQQIQQVQVQQQMAAGNFQQQQQAGAPGFNQQAALQAAIMNPAALQQVLQQQNPQLLHHFQQQQLQQLQQLHQQNLRLAAAFNQNQVGIFNATSALLQQIPNQPNERSGQKSVADVTNNDFEHFPTRDDTPSPQPVSGEQQPPKKQKSKASKDHNKDSAFDDISDDSSDSNGSSYCMELEEHEIPDHETMLEICQQVEEYLSDDYLATDKYLLRQLRSKSEGYLSVKLLTSFKKIKKLTRDWRVTAHALKISSIVELSNDGHRVKRIANLPENLRRGRTMTSILAIRVPDDWATLEAITNIFSAYGNITLARVLRPGRAIPPDLRNYATQIPDMGATTCAVVDFDSTDSAHECCRGLRDKNLRGMRIALLGPRIRRTLYKAEKKKIPENRQQRRMNTIYHQTRSNVSKEEGLKIIQSYFHNQVQPNPENPIDFPPLHATQGVSSIPHPFENMTSQMQSMTIGKPTQKSAWPTPNIQVQENAKPTLSQIVAQNAHAASKQMLEEDSFDNNSIHSSESGLSSPKPANCESEKPMKQFKGWNLTLEPNHDFDKVITRNDDQDSNQWCPWSTSNFAPTLNEEIDEETEWRALNAAKPPKISESFSYEPLPSLGMGQGIWSMAGKEGQAGW